jgi:hypothetical protein
MRITVSYYTRDIYDVPDEKWHEAMALYKNDEEDAFYFLMEEGLREPVKSDVTDLYIDVEKGGADA